MYPAARMRRRPLVAVTRAAVFGAAAFLLQCGDKTLSFSLRSPCSSSSSSHHVLLRSSSVSFESTQHPPQSTWRRRRKVSAKTRRTIYLSASGSSGDRGSFSWDEDVLDKTVKDMLAAQAVQTLRLLWSETGGDIYGQWLDRFDARQNLGDDVIPTMGWGRFLLKIMKEEPVEAVVVRTAKLDSDEVVEAQRKNNARPPTLSPWRHTVDQLSADWDAEEEEEMKVALEHPPQLKAVSKNIVVQPADIAKKLMDIREQLAVEWKEDLANISTENEEISRVDAEKVRIGDEAAERERRLTYDHGEAFGGNSSPFRADNYDALVEYVTEIGALAVQEKMRVNGEEMTWQWMDQFLFWAKVNSRGSGSAGDEDEPSPPISPAASQGAGGGAGGGIGEERGARGKEVRASFGVTRGGVEDVEEEDMRGNRLLEVMMMGQKVQMFSPDTGEPFRLDPAEVCESVMAARLGVAERVRAALETVPEDHGLVLRRYLEERWTSGLTGEGE